MPALVLRIPVAWMKRSVIRDFLAALNSPGFHFVTSGYNLTARRDSIDPISEVVFGEFDGRRQSPREVCRGIRLW